MTPTRTEVEAHLLSLFDAACKQDPSVGSPYLLRLDARCPQGFRHEITWTWKGLHSVTAGLSTTHPITDTPVSTGLL